MKLNLTVIVLHYGVIDSVTRYQEEPVDGPEAIILGEAQSWKDHKEGEISGTGSMVEQITKVKGRLHQSLEFWREKLQASPFVIGCIEEGYKLPLLYEPPQYREENQGSTGLHEVFVTEAVKELLAYECVVQVDTVPHICSPLSVVVGPADKKRLVLNLKYLNQFLRKDKFKYEDMKTVMQMLVAGDFMFKFDLKSGYHHVSIYKSHWKYLGFCWNAGDGPKYYVFTVMPFGLATACYVFTKIVRPLVRYWRGQGLRTVVYLDDGIFAVDGNEAAFRASEAVKEDLRKAGFVAHAEKSQWEPTRKLIWLGFELDLEEGKIKVPRDKLTRIQGIL